MKRFATAISICLVACATARAAAPAELTPTVKLVPVEYRHRLVQQLSLAEDAQQQWLDAIAGIAPEHREALAFVLVNMPEDDLKSLRPDLVLSDIDVAYRARAKNAWAAAVPREIFFRDVLPYANVNEQREDWRAGFFAQFEPLVEHCATAADAAQTLNRQVFKTLHVSYHATKRRKPDQSPAESEKIGYASCTGLSIILADACRAVGVPARVAGTPMWFDNSGNHTWTEIWDGQWYFVGAAEPGALDQTWFTDNAAKADDRKPEHRIYAASFARTDITFPMVWNPAAHYVSAVDVTPFYVARRSLIVHADRGDAIRVRADGLLIAQQPLSKAVFNLAADQLYTVESIDSQDNVLTSRQVKLPRDPDLRVDLTTR